MSPGAPAEIRSTNPLGVVSRLTGLSAHVLRAWERRHGAVRPLRSAGGTRRYRASDVARLRLLAGAVAAGHAIGEVANLTDSELRARLRAKDPGKVGEAVIERTLEALERLDAAQVERLLGFQLAALGPGPFVRDVAVPLLEAIGERWVASRLCIAAEHLATATLRGLLGSALRELPEARGPAILFATPSGERHELGLLLAAVVARGAGGRTIFLGTELPVDDLLLAARRSRARALALAITTRPRAEAEAALRAVRSGLPADVLLWIGGRGSAQLQLDPGIDRLADFGALQDAVELLAGAGAGRQS